MTTALILLAGVLWGGVLLGLAALAVSGLGPERLGDLGENLLLGGIGLFVVGAVGGYVVLALAWWSPG